MDSVQGVDATDGPGTRKVIRAVGFENTLRPSTVLSELVGILQIFLVLTMGEVGLLRGGWGGDVFLGSIILLVVSVLVMAIQVVTGRRGIGTFEITFARPGDAENGLVLTYLTPGGKRRQSIPVKSIVARPHRALYRPSVSTAISYANAYPTSLTVYFKGKRGPQRLELGFRSVDEMQRVYDALSMKAG